MRNRRFYFYGVGRIALAVALALASLVALPAVLVAQRKPSAPLSSTARNRIRKAVAAVGLILVRNAKDAPSPRPRGSAVIIRSDGIVVTNRHVITDARSQQTFDEIHLSLSTDEAQSALPPKTYRLNLLLTNAKYDLALLRIKPDASGMATRSGVFPFIELADSQAVKLLDDLIIIGYPEKGGTSVTLSEGVIEGKDTLGNWIKTDARVIHGNSGGAAVNRDGKLIGIPTKVEADDQEIDKDGDGFPDAKRSYGAVGYLRPANLVATMLAKIDERDSVRRLDVPMPKAKPGNGIALRGSVRVAPNGKPIVGALVGLVPLGAATVSETNLLAWGNTNADGVFIFNRPVLPGRYTLKARSLGFELYSQDVNITPSSREFEIQLRASPGASRIR
jgi:S1-C subfamily serine protease